LSDPRIRFGLEVRRIRKAKNWSQEELADACGLDRTYIGGIERGERNIALINIHKLAAALGVSPARFFLEIDE
jgi:transcriptional regulator with XRE-family HTH domain